MSDLVFDANAVGELVTYVAPGYLAFRGYRARFPASDAPAGETIIVSVVLSLPLVALVMALLPGHQSASQPGYVALLLAVAAMIGYLTALVRGTKRAQRALAKVGHRYSGEGTIYARTLRQMSDEGNVVIELLDGRRLWGCVAIGPQTKDDGIKELYLVYPEAEGAETWEPIGAAVIVPLSQISTITLSEDPTDST